MGVANLEELTGKPFDLAAAQKVARYYQFGGRDTNDTLPAWDIYSAAEAYLIQEVLGTGMMERWEKSQAIYREAGQAVQFHTYPNVGHWSGNWQDLVRFFRANNNDDDNLTTIKPSDR